WSFLLPCRCSVKWLMRCVRSAICTSAEPVSFSCSLNESIVFVLASIFVNSSRKYRSVNLNLFNNAVKHFHQAFFMIMPDHSHAANRHPVGDEVTSLKSFLRNRRIP